VSVFVDTGVFYAHHDRDTERHERAAAAMKAVSNGRYGRPYTSDYVYDETVTLTLGRTDHDAAARVGDRILGRGDFPAVTDPLFVDRAAFDDAIAVFDRYDDQTLSFTDATTVALARANDIDHILSFDDDFDGIVDRLDPGEV
jgi:predicted nucleic acid-binding protein